MNRFGPFIQHLVDEHLHIRELLKQLAATRGEDKVLLKELRHFVEDVHHLKEEKFLFPAIFEATSGREGGPNCSLFYGIFLAENLNERITKETSMSLGASAIRPESRPFVETGAFLSLPLEEHIAGRNAIQFLSSEVDETRRQRVLEMYLRLMDLHIRKEDQCLFAMADAKLSLELQNDLLEKAKASQRT